MYNLNIGDLSSIFELYRRICDFSICVNTVELWFLNVVFIIMYIIRSKLGFV